MNFKTEISL